MDRISIAIWGFGAFMMGMSLGVILMMDLAELSREYLKYSSYFTIIGSTSFVVVSIRQMRLDVRKKIEEQSNG